jgi:SAM-dependent methyltransferase
MSYNNHDYWTSLVGNNMSLQEVGWPQWTEAFNAARYKLTALQTIATLQKLYTNNAPINVLEIGCGVGFWTTILLQNYPTIQYTGLDISQAAIHNLASKYSGQPNINFIQIDITKQLPAEYKNQFDLVICMEVLLHIKDDAGWQTAINNGIQSANKYCIISDPFKIWHIAKPALEDNNKIRPFSDFKNAILVNNATLESVQARSFLLDNNIDFKTTWGLQLWQLFFKIWNKMLCIKNENLGKLLGKIAFGFDKWYTSKSKFGHSCRQIVIKKNA